VTISDYSNGVVFLKIVAPHSTIIPPSGRCSHGANGSKRPERWAPASSGQQAQLGMGFNRKPWKEWELWCNPLVFREIGRNLSIYTINGKKDTVVSCKKSNINSCNCGTRMYQGVFCCETQLEYLTQTSPEVSQKTSVVWYPTELDDLLACDGIPNIWEWFLHWKYMFFFLFWHSWFTTIAYFLHAQELHHAFKCEDPLTIHNTDAQCVNEAMTISLPSSFHHSFMPMKSPSVTGCASPPAMRAASPPIRASGRYKATSTAGYPLIMGLMRIMMVKTCWLMLNMVN